MAINLRWRAIALVITVPLLTFFADIMGLIGGAAISQFLLDVSPTQYLTRLPHVVDGGDFLVGLFKAPIFAFFIAIIGCMRGFRVSGSAESVGIAGGSGSGKSVLLKTLVGLHEPDAGEVLLNCQTVQSIGAAEKAALIGVLFQQGAFFPPSRLRRTSCRRCVNIWRRRPRSRNRSLQ